MKEKPKLDMARIAKRLRARREGKVVARGGYFGALELLQLRLPRFGGHSHYAASLCDCNLNSYSMGDKYPIDECLLWTL
jgi:hypothetical protein